MRRLTKKQAAIARERVKNPEATQTEIGSKLGVRRQRVQKVLAQPHVQESIREALDKEPRLRVKAVVKKLADKTTAKSEKPFLGKDGEIIYSKPLDDHNIQLRATELALELRGNLKKSLDITSGGEPLQPTMAITINCADIPDEKLKLLIKATDAVPAAKAQPAPAAGEAPAAPPPTSTETDKGGT
jgi:hypothetical protein